MSNHAPARPTFFHGKILLCVLCSLLSTTLHKKTRGQRRAATDLMSLSFEPLLLFFPISFDRSLAGRSCCL